MALIVLMNLQEPVSVTVNVPQEVKHGQTVLLRMEGVVMRRDAPALWNVYWNRVDEAHLVGYVSSPANAAARTVKPANFTLQLPTAAMAALRRQKEMRFTFVALRKLPEGGITITTVRLE
jgi:hypothetical protein